MKDFILQQPGTQQLIIADLLRARYEQTKLSLLYELYKVAKDLPPETNTTRALAILLRGMTEKTTLAKRTSNLAEGYRRIAMWIRDAANLDLQKFGRDIASGGIAPAAIAKEVGLSDTLEAGVLSGEDVFTIIRHATSGAGPSFTQREVVAMLIRLTQLQPPALALDGAPVDESAEALVELTLMIRFMEYGRALLQAPPPVSAGYEVKKPEQMVNERISTLRSVGGLLAYAEFSATHTVLEHAARTVQHPWFTNPMFGKIADSVTRAITEYRTREIQVPTGVSWPEFATDGLIDYRFTLGWPAKPPKPTTELSLPSAQWGDPLSADYSTTVDVDESMVARLAEMLWSLTRRTEESESRYIRVAEGMPHPADAKFSPVTIEAAEYRGGLATVEREMASMPIVSACLPRTAWHPETVNWRLLQTGALNVWSFYTYEHVKDTLKVNLPVEDLPVVIKGEANALNISSLPTILPIFSIIDEPAPGLDMSTRTLMLLWNMATDELDKYIKSRGGSDESIGLRLFAESLRFIGQLRIREKATKNSEAIIYPLSRTWYNALDVAPCFRKDDQGKTVVLVLGERTRVDINGKDRAVEFVLYPFSHVPDSARVTSLSEQVKLVPRLHERINKPLLVREAAKCKPVLEIFSWTVTHEQVADLVLVRTNPGEEAFRPIIVDSTLTDAPQRSRYYNAIVQVAEPTPSAPIGTTTAVPSRFDVFGSDGNGG